LATIPRIVGKSIFDYKYLREVEAKGAKILTVVKGTSAEPIYTKKSAFLPFSYPEKIKQTRVSSFGRGCLD
jgi:hypothetical protein